MKNFLSIVLVFIFSSVSAFAHQPRLVKESQIQVEDPTVSKAYYAARVRNDEVFYGVI